MKGIQDYSIEDKNFKKASLFGLFMIIYWLVARYILSVDISIYQNPLDIIGMAFFQILLYVFSWILIIISVIWTFNIAKQTNRNAFFLALIALIFPAITIFFVGFLTEKYENEEIGNVVEDTRSEYRVKYGDIQNNNSLDDKEKSLKLAKLEEEFNLILQKNLIELKAKEAVEYVKLLKEQGQFEKQINLEEQKNLFITDLTNSLHEEDLDIPKCPACNSYISEGAAVCAECHIKLI